jgi:hypothetical protein
MTTAHLIPKWLIIFTPKCTNLDSGFSYQSCYWISSCIYHTDTFHVFSSGHSQQNVHLIFLSALTEIQTVRCVQISTESCLQCSTLPHTYNVTATTALPCSAILLIHNPEAGLKKVLQKHWDASISSLPRNAVTYKNSHWIAIIYSLRWNEKVYTISMLHFQNNEQLKEVSYLA